MYISSNTHDTESLRAVLQKLQQDVICCDSPPETKGSNDRYLPRVFYHPRPITHLPFIDVESQTLTGCYINHLSI